MQKNRAGQLVFAIVVLIALFVIGRNLYRRYLNDQPIRAVKAKDVNAVRSLLDWGADVNLREKSDAHDKVGTALLDMITYPGQSNMEAEGKTEKIACLLIGRGASLNAKPYYMSNYLENACQYGRVDVVRCLLQKYATGIKDQ